MNKKFLFFACIFLATWAAPSTADRQDCGDYAGCTVEAALAALPPSARESHVFFPEGGSHLDNAAQAQLTLLVDALRSPLLTDTCLRLEGHADPGGPEDVNLRISWLRAEAVHQYLADAMGDDLPSIELAAFGESKPMKDLPKTSILHRRVALMARTCPGAPGG